MIASKPHSPASRLPQEVIKSATDIVSTGAGLLANAMSQ